MNDNDTTITHSPEVCRLLEELRLARESGAIILADLAQAESVLADLTAQRGVLEGRLRAREEALASSGALPEEPFAEEQGIQDVDRRLRVANARVKLIGGKLAESRADIDRLRAALRGAFGQFVQSRLTGVRDRFRETALALREIYLEQIAWCETAFIAQVKVPGPEVAVISDSEPIDNRRELLDSRTVYYRAVAVGHKQPSGPLSVRLAALHAEVIAAIGETKATSPRPSKPPAPKEQAFASGSLETFLGIVQQTGLGGGDGSAATQTSPAAEAGAQLPDLAAHDI